MIRPIAACLIALGATALAWLFGRQTDQEREWHDELNRRNEKARNAYQAAPNTDVREQALVREQAAMQLKTDYETYCLQFRTRLEGPAKEFEALAQRLDADLGDVSISPYRRNALRLLRGRLQDTQNRLAAFTGYCDWYMETLAGLARRQNFEALINMSAPNSRLPEDWFYSGKVVLASVAELDGGTNEYKQVLQLLKEKQGIEYCDARQRAMMMQYHDQHAIPIQMMGSKNPRYFKACVFRGALHAEHIIQDVPCLAFIEKAHTSAQHGEGYSVRCYPSFCSVDQQQAISSGIRAFLPRSEASFPGKNYLRGERVEVYIHYYDLLLSGGNVTVTQHPESLTYGEQSAAPIFVHVDTAVHDLQTLDQDCVGADWQLRSTVETDDAVVVSLQLGPWQVDAQVSTEDSQLRVTGITRTGFDSVELDALPCPVRLIDQKLKNNVFCDVLQFDTFLSFCRQQSLFGGDDQARKQAGQFFDRWNTVTEYLLTEEGHHTFVLTEVMEPDDRSWICGCDQNLEITLQKLIDKAQGTRRLFVEELYLGANGDQRWLQVGEILGVPEAVGAGRYEIAHKGVKRPESGCGYTRMVPEQQRLRFPNKGELANLGRQKQALQGFLGGRLINHTLQQILLMPDRYVPQPDPFWVQRVADGLEWQDPHWQDPAKSVASKRVIEAALTESNLYLVQGPPGTGKTTCIVELLYQLFIAKPDSRVLVVSQQNTAVDNALDRFLEQFPDFSPNVLRVGNDATKVQESVKSRLTENVLMEFIRERQQDYSLASLQEPLKAEWIGAWMDSIYRTDKNNRPQFDDELTELVVQAHCLVGATCVGLASRRYGMDRLTFDICIVDEGGRATVPELLIPLMRSRKAIIIGDHFQLPPSIASRLLEAEAKETLPFLEETFLKTSFFEQLYEHLPPACSGRLIEQFRMVEPIGDLVADLFYTVTGTRGLHNGKVHKREHFLDPEHCLRWVDVPHGKQENEQGGPSLLNRSEAHAIQNFLLVAADRLAERKLSDPVNFKCKTVAIITPYGAQKRLISQQLLALRKKNPALNSLMDIDIDTVDSFQGSEADIVLYSTVRTEGGIRFLLDRQRLNVACSRARENLTFFGHARFLRQRERGGEALFTRIIERSTRATAIAPAVQSAAKSKKTATPVR
ncbi:DEAD/DEAH box helicase [Pseudomonas avellanae]|uniref:DEAD/DEAH box helicase n=1 Tax=Pseudomonas avellanae TaxID=46257 RepID=UPI00040ADBFA|nr:AAA domain-containing protein [Pseudomonas avellanae]